MTSSFHELTDRLKETPIDELRKDQQGYLEFVLSVNNLSSAYSVLENYFGPPFKPAGVASSKEAMARAASYGGIEKQQTLFYIEHGKQSSCAMIWPWQDKARATIKVAQGELIK